MADQRVTDRARLALEGAEDEFRRSSSRTMQATVVRHVAAAMEQLEEDVRREERGSRQEAVPEVVGAGAQGAPQQVTQNQFEIALTIQQNPFQSQEGMEATRRLILQTVDQADNLEVRLERQGGLREEVDRLASHVAELRGALADIVWSDGGDPLAVPPRSRVQSLLRSTVDDRPSYLLAFAREMTEHRLGCVPKADCHCGAASRAIRLEFHRRKAELQHRQA